MNTLSNALIAITTFAAGTLTALVLGLGGWILWGFKLRLYLISRDTLHSDQAVIPISAELKKASLWRTVLQGNWREDLEVKLADSSGKMHSFEFGFHPVFRYFVTLKTPSQDVLLGEARLKHEERAYLKNGMSLQLGSRRFEIWVMPTNPTGRLNNEFDFAGSPRR